MVFSSCRCSGCCRLYECSLLYMNLTAAYLCCGGWFDVYGIMASGCRLSVNYCFPSVGVLWMLRSR
jgi:hypothetical protein